MNKLTPTQTKGLAAIERLMRKNGIPPMLREIQSAMGYKSVSGVQNVLRGLKEAGAIDWVPGVARSIRIIGQNSKILEFDDRRYQNCTALQIRILRSIVQLTNEQGRPPSTREVLELAEIPGTQTLLNELKKLRAKRVVTWRPGQARTLRVRGLAATQPDRPKQS